MKRKFAVLLVSTFFVVALAVPTVASPLEVFEIGIDNVADATLGSTVDVSIRYLSGSEIFSGFDFLVSFDAVHLDWVGGFPGDAITACGWEDFSVQQIPCPGCEKQFYLISAVADIEDGNNHPTCHSTFGELARLRIKLPVSESMAGELFAIDFYWEDCGSNILTNPAADTTYFGKFIFDHAGSERTGLDPNLGGTLPGCVAPDGVVPVRSINYYSGSITLSSELGLYGDINGDGRVNIADCVYLIRYIFYNGPPPQDYLSGDVDMDGATNIGDALYLLDYLFGLVTP